MLRISVAHFLLFVHTRTISVVCTYALICVIHT